MLRNTTPQESLTPPPNKPPDSAAIQVTIPQSMLLKKFMSDDPTSVIKHGGMSDEM
jgi:hypothetical protein